MSRCTEAFSCTTCPSECSLHVTVERDGEGGVRVLDVSGNRCPRGDAFARQEVGRPVRVLTTTVLVRGGDERLLPVRTAEAIPRDLARDAMGALRTVSVDAPVRMGDVVVADILETGVDVVASMDVGRSAG